jgi:hypothetical protein
MNRYFPCETRDISLNLTIPCTCRHGSGGSAQKVQNCKGLASDADRFEVLEPSTKGRSCIAQNLELCHDLHQARIPLFLGSQPNQPYSSLTRMRSSFTSSYRQVSRFLQSIVQWLRDYECSDVKFRVRIKGARSRSRSEAPACQTSRAVKLLGRKRFNMCKIDESGCLMGPVSLLQIS